MIVDKHPLPDDPTPTDAPPSYDAILTDKRHRPPEKSGFNDNKSPIQPGPESPLPSPPLSPPSKVIAPIEFVKKDKGKSRSVSNNWFSFTAASSSSSRASHEIRNTVLGLLRDLVQDHASNSPAAVGILSSCADACASHGVLFSDILQQRYIEEHTPIYWAIVKRLPDDHPGVDENQGPDLLTALISYASPLKEEMITEIREACLATSDQNLFKRLRQSPGFARMSTVDQMLLGVKTPLDEIEVEEISSDEDAFSANFLIPQFHKRMAISKLIPLEFIARGMYDVLFGMLSSLIPFFKGRLWCLNFLVASETNSMYSGPPAGSWCISLSLQESSPPTHVDSRLLILEALSSPSNPVSQPDTPPSSAISFSLSPSRSTKRSKSKAVIIVRLQTSIQQLESPRKHSRGYQILEPLENEAIKLQYTNNPYIGSDEKLRARFEARLGKPDKDCIIC